MGEEMPRIIPDNESYSNLITKYTGNQKPMLDEINRKCKHYSKFTQEQLEKRGFEKGKKGEFLNSCGDSILLIQTDYKEIEREVKEKRKEEEKIIFGSLEEMVDLFLDKKPIFYDKNKILWKWNKENYFYEIVDDIDLYISISEAIKEGIGVRRKFISLILERARLRIPKEIKGSWVQFKDKIYDIETGESFEATPKYFVTNPIPWKVGKSEETPTIDKLFSSWVNEEHKEELYEITSFCCIPKYFIHRIIFCYGSGSNGKSTFDNLLERFLGENNITTSSLERLQTNSRFETAKLYRKLVVLMSEANSEEIKKSDILKSASGEEKIPGEHKGKTPFDFRNYAKLIIPTNTIPKSNDESDGFYRRTKVIDFPNQFQKEKDVLSNIPSVEFENLARKCLKIMERLWKDRIFSNDGDFKQRRERYQERTKNPIEKFIEMECNTDNPNEYVSFALFYQYLYRYLEKNKLKLMNKKEVGMKLNKLGWEKKLINIKEREEKEYHQELCILGIKIKSKEVLY